MVVFSPRQAACTRGNRDTPAAGHPCQLTNALSAIYRFFTKAAVMPRTLVEAGTNRLRVHLFPFHNEHLSYLFKGPAQCFIHRSSAVLSMSQATIARAAAWAWAFLPPAQPRCQHPAWCPTPKPASMASPVPVDDKTLMEKNERWPYPAHMDGKQVTCLVTVINTAFTMNRWNDTPRTDPAARACCTKLPRAPFYIKADTQQLSPSWRAIYIMSLRWLLLLVRGMRAHGFAALEG